MGPAESETGARNQLADIIERRAQDVVDRWIEHVRADAAAERVPLTDLQDGILDYLTRLADLLRGSQSLEGVGVSAWADVAREHALTRVRLGFDVAQLFHELVVLRRVTIKVLSEERLLHPEQMERLLDLIDSAITSSIKSYIDFRDHQMRRAEAERIGFLTHDLKNPLSAVVIAAEQLGRHELPPTQRRLFEILERNIDRIRRMVDGILLTERLQVGAVESRPVDVTVGQLIGDAVEVFQRSADGQGIQFRTDYDPNLVLHTDPQLTLSSLENLLDNALKYTEAGEVTLEVEEQSHQVVFHVPCARSVRRPVSGGATRDFRAVQEGAFHKARNRSWSRDRPPRDRGAGRNDPCRVLGRIRMPLLVRAAKDASLRQQEMRMARAPQPPRILLINDEPDLLFLYQFALENAGYRVETLSEGSGALETVKRFRPDVIGLDWVVPDMSGEEVLRQLKANVDTQSIPILIMTALEGLDSHARLLGAECVLHKPFRTQQLIAALDEVLTSHRTLNIEPAEHGVD